MAQMLKISVALALPGALFYGAAGLLLGFAFGLIVAGAAAIVRPHWFY